MQLPPDPVYVDGDSIFDLFVEVDQVAQNLRASDVGREMLLIALTGYGRPEDRARALDSGFDVHLVRPVAPEKLQMILTDAPLRRQSTAPA